MRSDQPAKEALLGGQQPHLLQEIQELHHEVAGSDDGIEPVPPARPLLALHAGPLEGPHEAHRRIVRRVLGPRPDILHTSAKAGV
jgi:hypothetical protein